MLLHRLNPLVFYLFGFIGLVVAFFYFNKTWLITYHIYLYYLILVGSLSFLLKQFKYKMIIYSYFTSIIIIFWTSLFFLFDWFVISWLYGAFKLIFNLLLNVLII